MEWMVWGQTKCISVDGNAWKIKKKYCHEKRVSQNCNRSPKQLWQMCSVLQMSQRAFINELNMLLHAFVNLTFTWNKNSNNVGKIEKRTDENWSRIRLTSNRLYCRYWSTKRRAKSIKWIRGFWKMKIKTVNVLSLICRITGAKYLIRNENCWAFE